MKEEIALIDDGNFKLLIELKEAIEDRMNDYVINRYNSSDLDEMLNKIPSLIIINEERLSKDISKIVSDIKNDESNYITPIIVISKNSSKKHRLQLLKSDILYYIRTPIDHDYLYSIIKNMFTLLKLNRKASPLTGLPGNIQIQTEMKKRLNKGKYIMMYIDLDNFKSYNDVYGFSKGDEIIKYTAKIIYENIMCKNKAKGGFVGHIGGDDFIAMITEGNIKKIAKSIIHDFESGISEFFNKEDLEKGYLEVPNRKGIIEQSPITSVSIGIVEVTKEKFKNILEVGEAGAQVKKSAKKIQGSSYFIDRREE